MQHWKNRIYDATVALNILLFFLFIFDQRIRVPLWLQLFGRMHAMMLHFPIVILAICIVWELFAGQKKSMTAVRTQIGDQLLLAGACTAVITALMGLFLSREPGYSMDVLALHKWGGILVSLLSLAWYTFRVKVRLFKPLLFTTTLTATGIIIVTSHLGANITHGQDFLLAPFQLAAQRPVVLMEDARVYADMVQPILQEKCMSCHNSSKAKGELVMETREYMLKGGKDGKLWDTTANDLGLLLQRMHLPLESKKHMPPEGKPQLTDQEAAIIYQWIREGASFTVKVDSLSQKDTLRALARSLFPTIETDDYSFAAADEKKVAALNNNYRVVRPLALGSPALNAEFFSIEQFKSEQLKDLLAVKDQVVSLNLDRMPVVDEDLKTISQLTRLRRLYLSFTNITGATLHNLSALKQLKILSLSGTKIKSDGLRSLVNLPQLSQVYVWNTAIQPEEFSNLKRQFKSADLHTGFRGDTVIIKLNPPVIQNEDQILTHPVPLELKHYVKGVTIRYTTDGTDPDSLRSPLYGDSVMLDKEQVVKAKAFKPGWISSDVVQLAFYKSGFAPDSVQLLSPLDSVYKGNGSSTLHDGKKGSTNFRDGLWLGFRVQPLAAMFYFNKKVTVSTVTISSVVDINSYLMPPQEIEVWGGRRASSLHLLKRVQPQQPAKVEPPYLTGYDVRFAAAGVTVIKVVIKPVGKLPVWHRGKGDKGWIFVDEILFN